MRNYLGMKKSGLPVKQMSPQHNISNAVTNQILKWNFEKLLGQQAIKNHNIAVRFSP